MNPQLRSPLLHAGDPQADDGGGLTPHRRESLDVHAVIVCVCFLLIHIILLGTQIPLLNEALAFGEQVLKRAVLGQDILSN